MSSLPSTPAQGLLSRGMAALLGAQFLSAMADNLLFVAAIALLKQTSGGDSLLLPLLQVAFVLAFIFLAPYVGPFADAFSKGRVMFHANLVKLAGAALILVGVNPLLGYAVAGVGAAIYSPAKYGILTQLVTQNHLVKANSLLEGSTIAAILLGVLAGGWLTDQSVLLAVEVAAGFYLLAAAANLGIPTLPVIRAVSLGEIRHLPQIFVGNVAVLWRNNYARFSIMGTSLFWGMGASLRLLMFAWVPAALNILDNQAPANLMGLVSIGIVLGAGLAAFLVRVAQVNRALVGGVLLGPLVILLAPMHSFEMAAIVLVGVGMAGGYFVVPLNALLQERGHETIGSGRTLAVQNLFENLAMLGMAGLYFLAVAAGMNPVAIAYGFGGIVTVGMVALVWRRIRHTARIAARDVHAEEKRGTMPD
jgi:LPLT family lysophospholipid transporter-like MFS transporter